MQRGIRRQAIFTNDEDFLVFLSLLKKEIERFDCVLHAYCLMTNHYHLLLETTDKEIWKFMKNLSQHYARYYNSKHSYTGHLFEGRYVSVMVTTDEYFLQVSRYIHLNPVKAHMCKLPEHYQYSSYRSIINMNQDGISSSGKTLGFFKDKSVIRYRDFIEDIGHKYQVSEELIRKSMGEDELWLPW